jgi:alkylation response protein AidB-like acyl-CoA dehydrogenase
MDLDYPPHVEEFRAEVRRILAEELPAGWAGTHAISTVEEARRFVGEWRRTMHRRGLLGVAWPVAYGGRDLTMLHQVVLVEELARAGLPFGEQPADSTGVKMLGNTLLQFGTEEQKRTILPALLSGEQRWCQGFSEPGAGSDLAAVNTRARMEGQEWVVDGQKIWTSGADTATGIFALVRTDSTARKHKGLSFLLIPLDQPGVSVRPIRHAIGSADFCEVFFDGARTAADMIVGEPGDGWQVASTLLAFERGEEAATNPIYFRAELDRLFELARRTGRDQDPVIRQRLGRAHARVEVMRYLGLRILSDVMAGDDLGNAAAVSKLYWSEYHREVTELALDVQGIDGLTSTGEDSVHPLRTDDPGADPASSQSWWSVSLNARAGTIYAGTSEIQRNIVAERALGLPRERQPAG